MIPTLGYYSLIIALLSALMMGTLPFFGKSQLKRISIIVCSSIACAFFSLIYCFAVSDFSLLVVAMNSHTAKPLIYKISGTWGNHEGSMLLWVFAIGVFTAGFAWLSNLPEKLKSITLASQGWIITGFLAFILVTSNPFRRLSPVPENGLGLNPLLQDIGLAMHPPMLYAGYVGFSIGFSAAIALLLLPQENASLWAKCIKPWVLISWALLTLGVGLGSWWAYRELGWGGFWFWDPVENASIMPWLSGTALIHSMLMLQKRDTLKRWCVLLAVITFALSLMGTFLVRSGVLTSVHAFASDPNRGMFILGLLGITLSVSLGLFAFYAPRLKSTAYFSLLSREAMILFNNILLLTACATVVLGTLYPLLLEVLTGQHITVGAPYFNRTVNLIALPIVFLTYIGTVTSWSNDRLRNIAKKSIVPLGSAVAVVMVVWFAGLHASLLTIIALALAVWLLTGTLLLIYWRYRKAKPASPAFVAMILAHAGFAVLVLGITIVSQWQEEKEVILQPGKSVTIGHYTATLDTFDIVPEANYLSRRAAFSIRKDHCAKDCHILTLMPETRYYPVENRETTESAIHTTVFSNLYVALGDVDEKGNIAVRLYVKPGVNLIWFGGLLMAMGGAVALIRKKA